MQWLPDSMTDRLSQPISEEIHLKPHGKGIDIPSDVLDSPM